MSRLSRELDRAVEFALLTNRGGVQPWMTWHGWDLHVGCDHCADEGAFAVCWGLAGCHGYQQACGCSVCSQQQLLAEAGFEASLVLGLGGMDVVSLRAELAAVSAQIRSSDDGSDG